MEKITQDFKVSGIYCIENIINHKTYIGSSKNIYQRLLKHFTLLRHNKHENAHLQSAWNKYGEESFDFNILERCDEDRLNEREYFYVQHFHTNERDNGYNLGYIGDYKGIVSEEARQKMSQAQLNRWTEELREERSLQYKGENNPFYGKHHSEEVRRKVTEANRRRVWSDESRAKEAQRLAERNKLKRGTTIPQDVRDKISQSLKGRPSPSRRPVVQLDLNGNYIAHFDSMKEASINTGVLRQLIGECCRKLRNDAGGFIWKYKEEYDAE
jgi:group I intron endonuclease